MNNYNQNNYIYFNENNNENIQILNKTIQIFIKLIDEFIEKKENFLNRRENSNRNFTAENETLNRLHYFINNDTYNCLLEIRIYYCKIKEQINQNIFDNWFNHLKKNFSFKFEFENDLIINIDKNHQ